MIPLRVGLIGCGQIGRVVHLETLRRLPNAQVVSLADADSGRLKAAHAQFPIAKPFTDYRELLDRNDADAVVICLPNALHAEAAIKALEKGRHVYLEKPLAINVEEGRKVLEAWRRSGRVGMIGFNYRYNPLHREFRRQLQAGRIGELIGARSVWTTAAHHAPDWKTTRQTGGGVLLDLASHHFDLIRFWFDQHVVEVYASVRSHRFEGDTATVQLRLTNGLLVEGFFSTGSIDHEQFEVYGVTGKLSFDRFNSWSVELTDPCKRSFPKRYFPQAISALPHLRFAINKLRAPGLEPSFAMALARFVSAAQTGQQIHPDFDDGFESLAVVLAAEESASLGTPVALPRARS